MYISQGVRRRAADNYQPWVVIPIWGFYILVWVNPFSLNPACSPDRIFHPLVCSNWLRLITHIRLNNKDAWIGIIFYRKILLYASLSVPNLKYFQNNVFKLQKFVFLSYIWDWLNYSAKLFLDAPSFFPESGLYFCPCKQRGNIICIRMSRVHCRATYWMWYWQAKRSRVQAARFPPPPLPVPPSPLPKSLKWNPERRVKAENTYTWWWWWWTSIWCLLKKCVCFASRVCWTGQGIWRQCAQFEECVE